MIGRSDDDDELKFLFVQTGAMTQNVKDYFFLIFDKSEESEMANRLNEKQKEALLQFMESHKDFAKGRVNAQQGSQCSKMLWEKLRNLLNGMPGATKTVAQWKEVWSSMRSDARQHACSNGVPKTTGTGGGGMSEDEENDDSPFYTDNPFVNRIMAIIGWDVAMGVEVKDGLETISSNDLIEVYNYMCLCKAGEKLTP
ncbi:hypothetical protein FOCC_FOCC010994 [Frankliniella occidentalis]|nr:hypothetical protein FOCC_FOCC010994 [Frankliniella occidentalis]